MWLFCSMCNVRIEIWIYTYLHMTPFSNVCACWLYGLCNPSFSAFDVFGLCDWGLWSVLFFYWSNKQIKIWPVYRHKQFKLFKLDCLLVGQKSLQSNILLSFLFLSLVLHKLSICCIVSINRGCVMNGEFVFDSL